MTVRTNELALSHLLERESSGSPMHESTDLETLRATREVIPLHGCVVERLPTVGARSGGLQILVPALELGVSSFSLSESLEAGSSPVLGIVRTPAALTPRLSDAAPPMELVDRLPLTTSSA